MYIVYEKWDSSVNTVTGCGLRLDVRGLIADRGRDFSLLHNVLKSSELRFILSSPLKNK
jgi:hypothetical protein